MKLTFKWRNLFPLPLRAFRYYAVTTQTVNEKREKFVLVPADLIIIISRITSFESILIDGGDRKSKLLEMEYKKIAVIMM